MVLLKFFAQGTTINAEARRGPGLVVIAMSKHGFQHRLLDFGNYSVEQMAGQLAVKIVKILANRHFYRLLQ